jgi:hypothetical protein
MPEGGPIGGTRREDKRGSVSHRHDVPVAGLPRDSIVGITGFLIRCRGAAGGGRGDGGARQRVRDLSRARRALRTTLPLRWRMGSVLQ